MNKEEKELLIKDLCSRLSYGVKVNYIFDDGTSCPFVLSTKILDETLEKGFKPYLRPLSSMTDDEKRELSKNYVWRISGRQIQIWYHTEGYWDQDTNCPTEEYLNLFEWLNKHHFDYRHLIEKGLALEAPADMYKED